jgi:branched-chain amino acid transport system substrate-binding protein
VSLPKTSFARAQARLAGCGWRRLATLALIALAALGRPAEAQQPVRIGVLNDQSGALADIGGPGSVEAARMAIADFGGKVLGRPVELLSADHQNKPEVGLTIARGWYDTQGVDMITDLTNSSIALAVQNLAKEKNKVAMVVTAGSTELTGKQCSPTGAQWVYDTYATASGLVRAMKAQGRSRWFFIAVDYTFGRNLVEEATAAVKASGGEVLGAVFHPLGTSDFSSYLLQAQASKANVIALANSNIDTVNVIKQAGEFGIGGKDQTIAATLMTTSDVKSMGLSTGKGITFLVGWYWDLNEQSRSFAQRFFKARGAMPSDYQAGVYSAVLHYLRSIEKAGTSEAAAVMAAMRELPIKDIFTAEGRLREDGRMVHDMYYVQVKSPEESSSPWDVVKVLETIPGDVAFRPLSQSQCPLVKK